MEANGSFGAPLILESDIEYSALETDHCKREERQTIEEGSTS
jgi:hypothetical protein